MKNNILKLLALLVSLLAIFSVNSFASSDIFNNSDNAFGVTPLMSAVVDEDISGVTFFAKSKDPFVNYKNIGGASALHLAARVGNLDIVKILIANEAKLNQRDNEDWTPLMRATTASNADIILFLLQNGANASLQNSSSKSVIVLASQSSCSKCLDILLNNYDFKNNIKERRLKSQLDYAFEIARKKENNEIQAIITKYYDEVLNKKNIAVIEEDISSNKKFSFKREAIKQNPPTLKKEIVKEELVKEEVKIKKVIKPNKKFTFKKPLKKEANDIVTKKTKILNEEIKDSNVKVLKEVKTKKESKKKFKFNAKKSKYITGFKVSPINEINNNKSVNSQSQQLEADKKQIKEQISQDNIPEAINIKPPVKSQKRKFILFQGEEKKEFDIKIDDEIQKVIILDEKENIISEKIIENQNEEISNNINNKKTSFRFIKQKDEEKEEKIETNKDSIINNDKPEEVEREVEKNEEIEVKEKAKKTKNFRFKKTKQEEKKPEIKINKTKYILKQKYQNNDLIDEEYKPKYKYKIQKYDHDLTDDNQDNPDQDQKSQAEDQSEDLDGYYKSKRYLFIPNR